MDTGVDTGVDSGVDPGVDPGVDKAVILIRAKATDSDREEVWTAIEQAARSLVDPSVAGLVVSKVTTAFAEDDPLVALVEFWGTGLDADALAAAVTPPATDLEVTAATCSQLIFKSVSDFARPGSPYSIKLAGTAFRREDFDPDAFFDYWTNIHAPIGGSVPGVGGYTVSRAVDGRLGMEEADAIIEQWYVSEQAFHDAQSTDQAKAAWNDVGNYAKTTGTAFWLMTESVIIEPPAIGPGTLEA